MGWLVVVTFLLTPAPGTVEQTAECPTLKCVGDMLEAAPLDPRVISLKVVRKDGSVMQELGYYS